MKTKRKNRNNGNHNEIFSFIFCWELTAAQKSSKTHYTISIDFNLEFVSFRWDKVFFYRNRYLFHSYQFSFVCVFDSFAYDTEIHREVFFLLIDGTADKDTKIEKKSISMYIKQWYFFGLLFKFAFKKQSIRTEKRIQ